MSIRRSFLDQIDQKILEELGENCRIPLGDLANKLTVSQSTIHYRIKRLEDEHIIQGYHADIDLSHQQEEFNVTLFITTKSGPEAMEKVNDMISNLTGVWGIFKLLGNPNLLVHIKASSAQIFLQKIYPQIVKCLFIEKTEYYIVTSIVKNQPRPLLLKVGEVVENFM